MIENKNILIIGGSSGIGLALAELLSSRNSVYVASRSSESLSQLKVNHIAYDATSGELDVSQLPDNLHGFVYCPGSINLKPLKMLSNEAFRADMEINFFAMLPIVQVIMPNTVKIHFNR